MEKALKSALKVIEGENGRLRRGSLIYPISALEKQEVADMETAKGEGEEAEEGRRAIDLEEE
jgi:hypothetical protein